MLLTNQPSAAVTSNRTAESTSRPRSDFGAVKRSGSRKKFGVERRFKAIEKSGKTGRRSKALLSPGKIKIKIQISLTAASTGGASTGASSDHDVPVEEVDDDGELTIPPRSLPGQEGTSDT